ncbi:hypothetical protein [Trichloromonas acetexigens]|uniref:Zinc-ribbon domain-containing protein n=1 Tax=Trichloromonas acetexigens TaxID=38815 RepID=A0A550JG95_9BACT|nr:hypothetical protein [Desulfuromonas acetexigens]MDY0187770.1 hypothetical protein [Syntrophus sp. (in: bacteria)]TRO82213.1 hypothetical protein FL622_06440 [Desulfuromonas acetexigens]
MRIPQNEAEWSQFLQQAGLELLAYVPAAATDQALLSIRCHSCRAEEHSVRAGNLIRRKVLCRKCSPRQSYTTERIKDVIAANGGLYLGGEVTSKESLVWMNCPGCGREATKTAHDVIRRPESCAQCRLEKARKTVLTVNQNLAKAQQIAAERGGKCLTTEPLISTTDPLRWECAMGHTWEATLGSVDGQGTWCPTCNTSRSENLVRAILEAAFDVPFPRQHPAFLQGLELDGFSSELNLAFEANGVQHHQRSPMFHASEQDFQKQQERDHKKQELCREAGITLLVIPHSVTDVGALETRGYIAEQLAVHGFVPPHDPMTVEIDPRKIYDRSQDETYQMFVEIVAQNGGTFDPADYLGVSRPLQVTCENGHTTLRIPNLILKGHWCAVCAGSSRHDLEHIRQELGKEGWSLASEENVEYRNAHQTLPMVCPSGHRVNRTWNAWKNGGRSCRECRREAIGAGFLEKMSTRGFAIDLDNQDYVEGSQIVAGTCRECSGTVEMTIIQWKVLAKCPECGRALPAYHPCLERKKA